MTVIAYTFDVSVAEECVDKTAIELSLLIYLHVININTASL